MHAARAGAKFVQLAFHVPFFHARNVGRADRGISRSVGIVAGNAGLKNFPAARRRVGRSHPAAREIQSTDQDQKKKKSGISRNESLNGRHAYSQWLAQAADTSSTQNSKQAELAFKI